MGNESDDRLASTTRLSTRPGEVTGRPGSAAASGSVRIVDSWSRSGAAAGAWYAVQPAPSHQRSMCGVAGSGSQLGGGGDGGANTDRRLGLPSAVVTPAAAPTSGQESAVG